MKITLKLISKITSATKLLACDCFDLRGRTRSRCPVCDGKGGMKSCSTRGGTGMSPDSSRQVRVCSEFKGRGYLHHEFSVAMRALIAKKPLDEQAKLQPADVDERAKPTHWTHKQASFEEDATLRPPYRWTARASDYHSGRLLQPLRCRHRSVSLRLRSQISQLG